MECLNLFSSHHPDEMVRKRKERKKRVKGLRSTEEQKKERVGVVKGSQRIEWKRNRKEKNVRGRGKEMRGR